MFALAEAMEKRPTRVDEDQAGPQVVQEWIVEQVEEHKDDCSLPECVTCAINVKEVNILSFLTLSLSFL